MNKKNKSILIVSIIGLFLVIAGITYSYFSARITGLESASTLSMTAGTLGIHYAEGDEDVSISYIYPREELFAYPFTISNYNGTRTSDVDMEYEIQITATTNLPLNYYVYQRISSSAGINEDELYTYTINETDYTYRKLPIELYEEGETEGNYYKYIQDDDNTYYKNVVFFKSFDNETELVIPHGANTIENFLILVEFPISHTYTALDDFGTESEETINYRSITEFQDLVDYIKIGIEANQKIN